MRLYLLLIVQPCYGLLAGCGQLDVGSELAGKIEIDGSSTVAPMTNAAADIFNEQYVGVTIPVGVSGTGGGFKRFSRGETDISDASRPIKFAEVEACRKNGVEFVEVPVAYDGLTVAVSKQNDWVEHLTVEQLSRIFLANSAAKTWQEVDPNWPDEEIKLFSPGTESGTFDYFKELVAGEKGSIRADMSVSEDDNNLVQGIANTRTAIGFFGAAYYFENRAMLKAVPILNPAGAAVAPTAETISDGSYAPFSRPLFIYVNARSARRPEIKLFVRSYLEHAAGIAESVGYVGLPERIYARAAEHFELRKTGTHYWTSSGHQLHGPLEKIYVDENRLADEVQTGDVQVSSLTKRMGL